MSARRVLKHVLGRTIYGSRLDALLLADTAAVVSFHRVQSVAPAGDGLTVDARTFESYCRFFSRHFRVVPLRRVVEKLERGQRLGRELAITFDDGYRDNHDTAAPILERLALPATFFVVTGWMGTEVVPWWDAERGAAHPWMTWDEVRGLRRRGFDVGAHTRTHADLGAISGADAEREVRGARLDLEREIGGAIDLFAYPYGGTLHLSDANRELVRAAGFRCCCANVGGLNGSGASPFGLQRIPISMWHQTPHQFGFDVALRRSRLTA